MKYQWIPTNNYYREIVSATDMTTREQLYRDKLIAPWKPMMDMMSGSFGADSDDEFGVARRWAWLLPEHLTEIPSQLPLLEDADAWHLGEQALVKAVDRMTPFADQIPNMDTVEGWLILANPEIADPIGRGYTGAIDFMQPRFVVQYDTPNDYNIPRLSGAVVHEFNHLVRLRVFPWDMANTSVGDYIIHEGIAESFAAELFGEDVVGYYVTDIDDAGLKTAKGLIADNLDTTGFNIIRGYIFGDSLAGDWGFEKIGMPDYGGYAIGYRVVQAYLKRTGKSATEATFVSAKEIIAESGFFG